MLTPTRKRKARALALTGLCCCVVAAAAGVFVAVAPGQRRLERRFHELAAGRPEVPAVSGCAQKVELLEEVCGLLLDSLASEGESRPGGISLGDEWYPDGAACAYACLEKYGAEFGSAIPEADTPPEDLKVLRGYLRSRVDRAGRRLCERGRRLAEEGAAKPADIVPICLVVPFLLTRDREWTPDRTRELPTWLKRPEQLDRGEWFALAARRPVTAYHLAAARGQARGERGLEMMAYLRDASERLVRAAEFNAAIHCLRTGASLAESGDDYSAAAGMRFQLAEVFDQMGQTMLAAEEMRTLLEGPYDAEDWRRAALLRLKYLFKASEYAAVVEEAREYCGKAEAGESVPSLCYIQWVAEVKQERVEEARKTREDFLARFPLNPLAADMEFAVAMEHLSKGEYEQGLEVLEHITQQFPDAKVSERSSELIERLRKTVQSDR